MGFQQIADHLLIPVHIAKEGYRQACEKGMKARIPKERLQRIDKKKKELTPAQHYYKMEREKQEEKKRKKRPAKKARKATWESLSQKERQAIKAKKRMAKIMRLELAKKNLHDPTKPPKRAISGKAQMHMLYEKYKVIEKTAKSIIYERPNGKRFEVSF